MRYDGRSWEAVDIVVAEAKSVVEVEDNHPGGLVKAALVAAGSIERELFDLVEAMKGEEHSVAEL